MLIRRFLFRFEIMDMHIKYKDFLLEFFYVSLPIRYHLNNMSLLKFNVRSWQGDILNVGKEWDEFILFVSFSSSIF
jgi:hypothetical protein